MQLDEARHTRVKRCALLYQLPASANGVADIISEHSLRAVPFTLFTHMNVCASVGSPVRVKLVPVLVRGDAPSAATMVSKGPSAE